MPALTEAQIIGALVYPHTAWPGSVITFSIPVAGSAWPGYTGSSSTRAPYYGAEPLQPGYGVLSAAQGDAFRVAVEAWARLIAVPIVETDDLRQPGEIRIAFTNTGLYGGYAGTPPGYGEPISELHGDIWLSSNLKDRSLRVGFDYEARDNPSPILLHELGHALGLKHPFEAPGTLPEEYDKVRYTVMSYGITNYGEYTLTFWAITNSDGLRQLRVHGSSLAVDQPMVYDILAVQSIYGANPHTAAGNDTYTFAPDQPFIRSIYDAGGIDTIDLTGHTRPSLVDLTPGACSSIDIFTADQQKAYWAAQVPEFAQEIAADWIDDYAARGLLYTGHNNLGIAFGTIIENVIGGSGNDTILGNAADNTLSGGAGDDSINGGAGNDSLDGGAGANTLFGGDGDDYIQGGPDFDRINGNVGNDTVHGGGGNDWVSGGQNDDVLYGDDGDDLINGNLGNDTCYGGAGADTVRGGQGDDVLYGGDGDDYITGDLGDDTMTGGAGADTFRAFAGGGHDVITDFNAAEGDRIVLDPGTTYSAIQSGANVIIYLGGGADLTLRNVQLAALPAGWIVGG